MTGAVSPYRRAATLAGELDFPTPRAFQRWAARVNIHPYESGGLKLYDRDVVMAQWINRATSQRMKAPRVSMRAISPTTTTGATKESCVS